MRKSIYDILGKRLNLVYEYEKLYELFDSERIYEYRGSYYSLAGLFEFFIEEWKYRNTYRNIDEILGDLDLCETTKEDYALEDILYLIELIVNVNEFINYKSNIFREKRKKDPNTLISFIYKNSNMLDENIEILLKELGYTQKKEDIYKIKLIKEKSDAIETALIVEDEDISNLILDYNDFRIEKDINAKKDILNSLGQYIEPMRKKIKEANSNLEDYIFFCLNKLHIRHNNKSGKDKIEYVANMNDDDLITWYDKVYDLILIAIRLLELPNVFKEFKDLKINILGENDSI